MAMSLRVQRYRRAVKDARATLSRIARRKKAEYQMVWFIHLPLHEAAMALGVSCDTIQAMCRRKGVRLWPARKIAALDRRIAKLEKRMSVGTGGRELRAKILDDWTKLTRERMDIYCEMMKRL
ncbi:hypothetical protein ACP70R_010656 [Stipagrostis hirtigluma subsp. patula]